jgi:periplasmic divalent cation tolerance protein
VDVLFVYITVKESTEASKIGRTLVEERLAACCNIIDSMHSIYHWDGKICEDDEVILIAKTKKKLFTRLKNRVKKIHSYSCPCIVGLPVIAGNAEYLSWIFKETID